MKKATKDESKDLHDEKTCFRCRLHALFEELYPGRIMPLSEQRFVIVSLGEASGQLLAGMDDEARFQFMRTVLMTSIENDEEEESDTRH
jgi:hypothetical protein